MDKVLKKSIYNSLFEAYARSIIIVNDEGRIVFCNHRLRMLLGYQSEDLINHRIEELVPEHLRDKHTAGRTRYTLDPFILDDHIGRDFSILTKNGDQIPIQISLSPFEIEGEKYIIVTLDDRREQNRIEELFIERERRHKETQSLAKMGSWELNIKTGELIWSSNLYTLFEKDEHSFISTYEAFLSAIHPDDREMVHEAYTNSLETRKGYSIIHRLMKKNGDVKYIEERGITRFDSNGQAETSFGTAQDVTEQVLAKQEIEKLVSQYKTQYLENNL